MNSGAFFHELVYFMFTFLVLTLLNAMLDDIWRQNHGLVMSSAVGSWHAQGDLRRILSARALQGSPRCRDIVSNFSTSFPSSVGCKAAESLALQTIL